MDILAEWYIRNMFYYLKFKKIQKSADKLDTKIKKFVEYASPELTKLEKILNHKSNIKYKLVNMDSKTERDNLKIIFEKPNKYKILTDKNTNQEISDKILNTINKFLSENSEGDLMDKLLKNLVKISGKIKNPDQKLNFLSEKLYDIIKD